MIFPYKKRVLQLDKSVIVAGVAGSGKSYLIDKLRKRSKVPLVHREVTEKNGIPTESIIHWPIAEKDQGILKMSFENAALVIMMDKPWEEYSQNIHKRKHRVQYTRSGLSQMRDKWCEIFSYHGLPIVFVNKNGERVVDVIQKMASALADHIKLL